MLKNKNYCAMFLKENCVVSLKFLDILLNICVCVCVHKNCLKCYKKCFKMKIYLFSCVRLSWMCEMFWFAEQLLLFLPRPTSPNASWASDWRSCSRTEWWFGIRLEFLALVEEDVFGDKGNGVILKWTLFFEIEVEEVAIDGGCVDEDWNVLHLSKSNFGLLLHIRIYLLLHDSSFTSGQVYSFVRFWKWLSVEALLVGVTSSLDEVCFRNSLWWFRPRTGYVVLIGHWGYIRFGLPCRFRLGFRDPTRRRSEFALLSSILSPETGFAGNFEKIVNLRSIWAWDPSGLLTTKPLLSLLFGVRSSRHEISIIENSRARAHTVVCLAAGLQVGRVPRGWLSLLLSEGSPLSPAGIFEL